MSSPGSRNLLDLRASPWGLLLLLPALSFAWPAFATVQFYPAWVAVPLAAWAGDRHGWRGVEAVAVGGALLVPGIGFQFGAFPSDVDVYLCALAAAALAASPLPLRAALPRARLSPGLVAAFVLLPLSLPLGRDTLADGLTLSFGLGLMPIVYLLLLLLGMNGTRGAVALLPLVAGGTAGIAIALATTGYPRLRYGLDTGAEVVAGLAWFAAGRYLRDRQAGRAPATPLLRHPRTALAVLLVLALGDVALEPLLRQLAAGDTADLWRRLLPLGTWYAVPLAALYGGLALRFRGVAVVVVAVTVAELAGRLLEIRSIDADAPLVAFAFGVLGTYVGDRAGGVATVWHPGAWSRLVAYVLLAIGLLVPAEDPKDFAFAAMLLAAVLALALAGRSLARRVQLVLDRDAVRGLVAAVGLALLAAGIVSHLASLAGAVAAAGAVLVEAVRFGAPARFDPDETAIVAVAVLVYLAVLLGAAGSVLGTWGRLAADLARIRRWLGDCRAARRLVPAPAPEPVEPAPGRERLASWLARLRNAVAAVAALLVLRIILAA